MNRRPATIITHLKKVETLPVNASSIARYMSESILQWQSKQETGICKPVQPFFVGMKNDTAQMPKYFYRFMQESLQCN
jgi:hypothetical protein